MPSHKYRFVFTGSIRDCQESRAIIQTLPIRPYISGREDGVFFIIPSFHVFTGRLIVADFILALDRLSPYVYGDTALCVKYNLQWEDVEANTVFIGSDLQVENAANEYVAQFLWNLSRATSLSAVTNAVDMWRERG